MLGTILLAAAAAAAPVPPAAPGAAPPQAAREQAADRDAAPTPEQERIFDARLARHEIYDNCVRTNALALAGKAADAETLARAAVVLCEKAELDLFLAGLRQCMSIGDGADDDAACADRFLDKWIVHAEREALRCIAAKRYKPAALAELCRMSEGEKGGLEP